MTSWYERRKQLKAGAAIQNAFQGAAQARSSGRFRVDRFKQQYFLSKYELQARGYEKIHLVKGCLCVIQGSFDGFVSANHCTIKIVGPRLAGEDRRPPPEFVVAVCMIPPNRRVSLGVDVEEQDSFTKSFVEFLRSTGAGAFGSSSFDPDVLLMQVKSFADAADACMEATKILLSDIAVTMPPVSTQIADRDNSAIDARTPEGDDEEYAGLKITNRQDKDYCYPIMVKRDIEKIMRFSVEGDKTEK